ncbi:thioredoxin family protein [Thermanaeromonas sp. C210]|uniref:thioredoxin family protein n=1 Tax=Thermanaeromonas sp. C210 TaxID=2731925 RepID=UPI00155CD6E0|nr:thioredoxin family protein [Thermanaeromonas sp. C210]GFN23876.1 thioredoxin family protein [Thermanaeromonas sp. C210]
MVIKVLGTGCARCKTLEQNVMNALAELGVAADVEKVTDLNKITDYGVMMTPGLVVNEKVKVFGRVPNKEEIKKWIQEEIGR